MSVKCLLNILRYNDEEEKEECLVLIKYYPALVRLYLTNPNQFLQSVLKQQ